MIQQPVVFTALTSTNITTDLLSATSVITNALTANTLNTTNGTINTLSSTNISAVNITAETLTLNQNINTIVTPNLSAYNAIVNNLTAGKIDYFVEYIDYESARTSTYLLDPENPSSQTIYTITINADDHSKTLHIYPLRNSTLR
jgi:glycine betaine/choline ABC-type transport system substrate-binding protein